MSNVYKFLSFFFLLISLSSFCESSIEENNEDDIFLTVEDLSKKNGKKESDPHAIKCAFQFYGKTISELLLKIAELKGINIILPSDIERSDTVINFSTPGEITMEEAEEYLLYFLSIAGYVLERRNEIFVVSKKTDDSLRRYLLPLYVDIPPESLPDNPGFIRTIYFLKNLRVPGSASQGSQSIATILLSMIPRDAIMVDPRSNCIILTAPSNTIASVMTVILAIDNFGIKDEVATLQLKHTSVAVVAKLLEDILSIAREGNPQIANNIAYMGGSFFSPQTKIVQNSRNNELIFLGKKDAIEKMIEFVRHEIDVPIEGGRSLVHLYNLKYVDAKKIAPVLQSVVSGRVQSGQSIKESGLNGCYRNFDSVRILAEEQVPIAQGAGQENRSHTIVGANRLIVVATNEDYQYIEKIIAEFDKPQPQIIVEVMILDIEVDDNGSFASQVRFPGLFGIPGVNMQSLMMDGSQVVISDPGLGNDAVSSPDGLSSNSNIAGDLLSVLKGGGDSNAARTILDNSSRSGLVIALKDPLKTKSIAGILQLEQAFSQRSVVANPYAIVQNNNKVTIKHVQVRKGQGNLSPNNTMYGGATVVEISSYSAALGIEITPCVMYRRDSVVPRVSLQIDMSIEDFKNDSSQSFDKLTRAISTNAHIESGNILVLGGLFKEGHTSSVAKVPILGDIPLLGIFIRKNSVVRNKSNLLVFIKPTVIDDQSLHDYIRVHEEFVDEECRMSVNRGSKDPIIRVFFSNKKMCG